MHTEILAWLIFFLSIDLTRLTGGTLKTSRIAKIIGTVAAIPTLLLAIPGSASASPGEHACTFNWSGLGQVCVYEDSGGYNATFASSGYNTVDFNLVINGDSPSNHVGDGGQFDTNRSQFYSYYFATGVQSSAYVCLYNRGSDTSWSQLCTPILWN